MEQHDVTIVVTPYDMVEKSERFSCKELKEVLDYSKNPQDREQLMKEAIKEGMLASLQSLCFSIKEHYVNTHHQAIFRLSQLQQGTGYGKTIL